MEKKTTYIRIVIISLFLIFSIFIGALVGTLFALTRDLPQIKALEAFQPISTTRIYSSDHILLAELFIEKREPVPLSLIPADLKNAIIATEDRAFYQHTGVDLKGILRAIIKDILALKYVEGASTISQQLSKTLFLTPQKTIVRKIKEAFLTFQLERRYTKDEILEFYLNQIYFGSGAYGVASAASIFFDKPLEELTLAECALIAGTPKAPSRYSPHINRDLALQRRAVVLGQMKSTGVITEVAYQNAIDAPLVLSKREKRIKAPYFLDDIKVFLEEQFGSALLYKGGLSVFTTLNYDLQQKAESAVEHGLVSLEKRMHAKKIENPDPQAALISLDIPSGGILAMVGGKNYSESSFNRAVMAKRQCGSTFKPIVYAFAIESGFPQNRRILDAPVVFRGAADEKAYEPENYSKGFLGEITLRHALALSRNIPAIRLLEMLGPSSVIPFAYKLGIRSPLSPNLTLALGSSGVTLFELTSAYSVFANGGKSIEVHGVIKVMDRKGQVLWQAKPKTSVVMSHAGAAIITDMMEGFIREGGGRKALSLNRPVAGKTGTSNDFKDALFVGYSPSIAAGVWVGQDQFQTLGQGEAGAAAALPIWIEFMSAALENTLFEDFSIPEDCVRVPIDPITGQRVSEDTSSKVNALFKKGTEPR